MCKYQYKGEWLTEEQLLNHPDFNKHSNNISAMLERDHINNNTGQNSDEQIFFFSPAANEAGAFVKYVQFKKGQLYELNKRLSKIEGLKKKRDITTAELTKLNNLEREILRYINGEEVLGITGLKQEIEDLEGNSDINAVGFYAEKDIERLTRLSNSDDTDDLHEAQRIIDFYTMAGTFSSNKNNPFFSKEEMFLEDENGNITTEYRLSEATMAQYKEWKDRTQYHQNILDGKRKEVTENTVNNDPSVKRTYSEKKFSYDGLTNATHGMKDTDWISMWTMDITQGIFSNNGLLPQVMFSYLTNSFEKKLAWARKIEEKIDKMNPGVQKELTKLGYSLRGAGILGISGASYQIFKEITKEGNETGGLIQRFVKEFFDEQASINNKFQKKFRIANSYADFSLKNKAFNKAFEEMKRWRRNTTIIMDINKIPEIVGSTPESDAHKTYLTNILGNKGYNEQVERQKNMLVKYESDRQSLIDSLLTMESVANLASLSDKSKAGLERWENNYDPKKGVEDYNSVNGIFIGDRKVNNFMKYNNFIPRKFVPTISINNGNYEFADTTTLTGHYNTTFETIESNPILSEFYDTIKEVCETIKENMPYEMQKSMAANTIPALAKTSAEIIADKNTGVLNSLFLGFRNIMEKIRLSFGVVSQSEISHTVLDPITGRANYKVNDQFLQGNKRAVEERLSIEKVKFIQAYNATMGTVDKLSNISRFSSLPLNRLNPSALVLLSQYLNVNISLAEINAGKLDKIKAVTGDMVEIGKYIRDFSLHSVVQSQSFDLAKIAKYFSNMTMAYAARQEALPILEIIKEHYNSISTPRTNNRTKGMYNANHEVFEMSGLRTNGNRQMDNWFERVALDNYGPKHIGTYGKKIYSNEEKQKIKEINDLLATETDKDVADKLKAIKEGFGKDKTATAFFDNILSWIRTLRLGYNLSSATTNFLEGVTSNMILSSMGEYFDPKEIYYGYNVVKHSFVKNVTFGLAETGLARKNRKLMDKFSVIMDSKNELQKSSVKTYASKLSWLNPHELNQRVEFINQSPIMIAMLRSTKIKGLDGTESSIWDAMDKEGHLKDNFRTEQNIENWENLAGEEYLVFKQKLHKAIVLGHGNYDELRGMMIKTGSAGKALMMFKTWIPMQLYWRFATKQDDIQSGTIGYKGRYWSYGKGTAAVHGAAITTILFGLGPFGVVAFAGGLLGGVLGNFGTNSGVGFLQEVVEATKQLAKKIIGMPVNLLAGKQLIGTGNKAFSNWVTEGGEFTEQDAKNLRGNMSDITIQLAWLALILLTKSLLWDDDDDTKDAERKAHNIIVNRLMTLSSQGAMYVNVVDALKSTIGSIAFVQYMEDVGKELAKVKAYMEGKDIIQSGINAGESALWNQSRKVFLPGMFKDGGPIKILQRKSMFGFDTQAERVFEESPFHSYFKSEATLDREDNKRERAERRNELEADKVDPKEIRKILDTELPTPTRLKKLGVTRDEYEEMQSQEE